MGKVQKVYSKEFKEEAVRLVQTSGKSITQIARFIIGGRNEQSMDKRLFRPKSIKQIAT